MNKDISPTKFQNESSPIRLDKITEDNDTPSSPASGSGSDSKSESDDRNNKDCSPRIHI